MILRQVVTTGVTAILLIGLTLTASQAQFASIKTGKTAPGQITFTNQPTNLLTSQLVSGSGSVKVATSVNFTFLQQDVGPYTAGQTISATLLFSADVTPTHAGKNTLSNGLVVDNQNFTNISLVVEDAQMKNLLTINQKSGGNSTGSLSGLNNGKTAALTASTGSNGFIYTSDFLKFTSNSTGSYNLSMILANALGINSNGYLNTFSTTGFTGYFSATGVNAIPEASTLLGFGGMLMGGGLLCLRRRKTGQTE